MLYLAELIFRPVRSIIFQNEAAQYCEPASV